MNCFYFIYVEYHSSVLSYAYNLEERKRRIEKRNRFEASFHHQVPLLLGTYGTGGYCTGWHGGTNSTGSMYGTCMLNVVCVARIMSHQTIPIIFNFERTN